MNGQNSAVGDGDAMHVAPQVIEQLPTPLQGRFAVNHPVAGEEGLGETLVGQRLAGQGEEPGAEELRESRSRHQITLARCHPLPGFGQSTAGDQAVHMGMTLQLPGPGVQDAEDTDFAADVARIGG